MFAETILEPEPAAQRDTDLAIRPFAQLRPAMQREAAGDRPFVTPTRAGAAAAPSQIQRAGEATPPALAPAAEAQPAPTAEASGTTGSMPSIEELTQQVYDRLWHRLRVEQERRGRAM